MLKYCNNCVLPNSRPNLKIDQHTGICNACIDHKKKYQIDWNSRKTEFIELANWAKNCDRRYDCLIPVSGGKDSHWQVIRCLEAGLHPLTFTCRPPKPTAIGQANLENLRALGVDHIQLNPDPVVERLFIEKSFVKYASPAIPVHMGMFQFAFELAVRFKIPLIVWGENAAFEYGSTNEAHKGFRLNQDWFGIHGNTFGTKAADWIAEGLSAKQLAAYIGPTSAEMDAAGVRGIFLGYYFQWDPEANLKLATKHGFKAGTSPKTGIYDYADLDDDFIAVHHFAKYYKFGFSRIQDNLSIEIRNGRLTRRQALEILKERGYDLPSEDLQEFADYLGYELADVFSILERFRNLNLWEQDCSGKWVFKYPITEES